MNLSKNRSIAFILAIGGLLTLVMIILASQPGRAAGPWYVAPGGDDGNDCLSPGTPCATINGALAKPGFVISDTVLVATGIYTGTGDEVVLLDKDVTLSGGWDEAFTMQEGMSTVDGEATRKGMRVESDVMAVVERFTVQNGSSREGSGISLVGGGIYNGGTLILNNSRVRSSTAMYGGSIYNEDTLILNNSTISGNTADNGGGIYNEDALILNNSTISGNTADNGAGIYNSGVTSPPRILILNNSTVSGNTAGNGGGIFAAGIVTLTNTILAGNAASSGPDCYWGTIDSGGYNLIGNTSDCAFTPSTGDLIDVDPRLFTLIGLPGYHPLRPGSPAIDAGNPAGCTDHLGNPLTTDQRGTPRPLDGDGDGNARCDMGAYEVDPEAPIVQVFLPCIAHNYCPDFFDDFSNPASGWEVVNDTYVRTQYLNGEYRILIKQADWFWGFTAPSCDRQNYIVEADARWIGEPGNSYGLIFGVTSGYEQFYLFLVSTDYRTFALFRIDAGWVTVVVRETYSSAIHSGTASNNLKVTRNGDQITLEVNGTVLGTWTDGMIGGLTGVGVGAASDPYSSTPMCVAGFDNFSVTRLPGSGPLAQEPSGVMAEESGRTPPNALRILEAIDMGW